MTGSVAWVVWSATTPSPTAGLRWPPWRRQSAPQPPPAVRASSSSSGEGPTTSTVLTRSVAHHWILSSTFHPEFLFTLYPRSDTPHHLALPERRYLILCSHSAAPILWTTHYQEKKDTDCLFTLNQSADQALSLPCTFILDDISWLDWLSNQIQLPPYRQLIRMWGYCLNKALR